MQTDLDKVLINVSVILGQTIMPVHKLLRMGRGAVVELAAGESDQVEVVANGQVFAMGQVIVAALSDDPAVDVVDRFFAPGCGIDEDPATGSAHCILGPLYTDKLGRPVVTFAQVFAGRGGRFETEARGDRILIRGGAVTMIESRLRHRP